MDVYSVSLLIAMVGTGIAVTGAVWARYRMEAASVGRIAALAGGLSVLLATFALVYHLATGHSPGSAQALSVIGFLRAHPAPLFTILLGAGSRWSVHAHSRARAQNAL